jgi:hypothetical protein
MRTKKVNRYWCDFCNKGMLSSSGMKNHENHCTKNPNRACKVCSLIDSVTIDMTTLISILPSSIAYHADYTNSELYRKLYVDTEAAMPKLREITNNCPACIMAALRQSNIPVPMVESFDFTSEMKEIFAEENENRKI